MTAFKKHSDPFQKVIDARGSLILDAPFYAHVALQLELICTKRVPTAATDGRVIYFNPDYAERLTLDEVKGVLVHEVWHVILLHPLRREDREMFRFNIAADAAINKPILDAGWSLPADVIDIPKFYGQALEYVYEHLDIKEIKINMGCSCGDGKGDGDKDGKGQGQGPCDKCDPDGTGGGIGDVLDAPLAEGQTKDEAKQEQGQRIKRMIQQAHAAARAQGNVPAEIERLVDALLNPTLPWLDILSRFLTEKARNDYEWRRPNRRYVAHNFYLPTLNDMDLGTIAFFADTSGSISSDEIVEALSEVQGIATQFNSGKVFFLPCDSAVYGTGTWIDLGAPIDPKQIEVGGGGGTDFRPPFEFVERHSIDPKCAVYFTDGYCNSFPSEPDYPTVWILTKKGMAENEFKPPFGEVLKCDIG